MTNYAVVLTFVSSLAFGVRGMHVITLILGTKNAWRKGCFQKGCC